MKLRMPLHFQLKVTVNNIGKEVFEKECHPHNKG